MGGGGGFHLPFRRGKPLLFGQRVEKSQWPAGGNVGSHGVELEVEGPKGSRSPSPTHSSLGTATWRKDGVSSPGSPT